MNFLYILSIFFLYSINIDCMKPQEEKNLTWYQFLGENRTFVNQDPINLLNSIDKETNPYEILRNDRFLMTIMPDDLEDCKSIPTNIVQEIIFNQDLYNFYKMTFETACYNEEYNENAANQIFETMQKNTGTPIAEAKYTINYQFFKMLWVINPAINEKNQGLCVNNSVLRPINIKGGIKKGYNTKLLKYKNLCILTDYLINNTMNDLVKIAPINPKAIQICKEASEAILNTNLVQIRTILANINEIAENQRDIIINNLNPEAIEKIIYAEKKYIAHTTDVLVNLFVQDKKIINMPIKNLSKLFYTDLILKYINSSSSK